MATSGTFTFNPSLGETILYSYARVGLRRAELVQEHMENARLAANMVLADWANDEVNLWGVDLQTVPLVPGQATYTVPGNTVLILDAYITQTSGTQSFDRIIYPVSRTDYASFPDKVTPGFPTTFWFDKLIAPTITLWQPPDTNGPYVLNYYRVRQVQDAAMANGATIEVPYSFLKAFSDGLSAELAVIYAPERAESLMAVAAKSWQKAANRNTEDVPLYLTPALGSYYNQS